MATKHTELLKDNNINVADLPKTTQDLISKFSAITDPAQSSAMDEKICKQIEKHATDKNSEKVKEEKKPNEINVSAAATSKPEEEKKPEPQKQKSPLSTIFGSK